VIGQFVTFIASSTIATAIVDHALSTRSDYEYGHKIVLKTKALKYKKSPEIFQYVAPLENEHDSFREVSFICH